MRSATQHPLVRPLDIRSWTSGAGANLSIATAMPYVYCLVIGTAIYVLNPKLLIGSGALDIRAAAVLPLALVAFAQTLVIFTRGIDLAVGGIISTVTALLATHLTRGGATLPGEVLALLILGAGGGAVNGLIIARTGLQPFIVTLATWSIWGGVAILVLPQEGGQTSPDLTTALTGAVFGVPKSILGVVLLFLAWGWLRWSRFVLDLKAIGSDEQRARLAGVRIARRKVQAYTLSGLLAAAAGVWLAGQNGGGSPIIGNEYILTSIAAVIIGGTSIFGGTGSAASSIAGAFAFLAIPDVIFALNITTFWTGFVEGVLLILAVMLSAFVPRLARRRRQ